MRALTAHYQDRAGRIIPETLAMRRRSGQVIEANSGLPLRFFGKTDLPNTQGGFDPVARVGLDNSACCWFVSWDEWLAVERWACAERE